MASHPDTKVDCSKVYIKKSSFSNEKTGEFDGAFAAVPIKKGASVFGLVVVIAWLQCSLTYITPCNVDTNEMPLNVSLSLSAVIYIQVNWWKRAS
jgi:hypothetical protein